MIRPICATCATTKVDEEQGYCANGHDDWLEESDTLGMWAIAAGKLNIPMWDLVSQAFAIRSSNGEPNESMVATVDEVLAHYSSYGTPERNAKGLLQQGKTVNINNGLTLITIEVTK